MIAQSGPLSISVTIANNPRRIFNMWEILLYQGAIQMERYEPIVTLGNILTIISMLITATVTIVSLRWRINLVEAELKSDVRLAKIELENKVSMVEQQRLTNKEAILDLRTTFKEHLIKDEVWQASIDKRLDEIQTDLLKMNKS